MKVPPLAISTRKFPLEEFLILKKEFNQIRRQHPQSRRHNSRKLKHFSMLYNSNNIILIIISYNPSIINHRPGLILVLCSLNILTQELTHRSNNSIIRCYRCSLLKAAICIYRKLLKILRKEFMIFSFPISLSFRSTPPLLVVISTKLSRISKRTQQQPLKSNQFPILVRKQCGTPLKEIPLAAQTNGQTFNINCIAHHKEQCCLKDTEERDHPRLRLLMFSNKMLPMFLRSNYRILKDQKWKAIEH